MVTESVNTKIIKLSDYSFTLNPQINVYYHRIKRITQILIQKLNDKKNPQLSINKTLIKIHTDFRFKKITLR